LPAELRWDDDVEAARGGEDQSLASEALEAFADGVAGAFEELRGSASVNVFTPLLSR
jgi:hypothetical protein